MTQIVAAGKWGAHLAQRGRSVWVELRRKGNYGVSVGGEGFNARQWE